MIEKRNFRLAEKVYFCETKGVHEGYIERFNDKTINVLEDDSSQFEGYRVWRIEEFFLAKTPEEAKLRWEDYKSRLNEYKQLLNIKRKQNHFFRGVSVKVEPFNAVPYKGMVLKIGKAALEVATEDGRFVKVDKAICAPINELINFQGVNFNV